MNKKQLNRRDTVRLAFVGSPLLDISANVDQDILDRFGLNLDDCVRAEDKHDPLFQRLFLNPESRISVGGSALNSAIIAKWILKDEGDVFFAGCIGDDEFGAWIKNQLLSEGVTPLFVEIPTAKTGVCVCLSSPGGKRSMCTRQGAAALFSTSHINLDHIRSEIQDVDCVFVVGYFVAHSPEVVLKLTDLCSPKQIFSLSLSAEYVCRDYVEVLQKVIPRVNVLFGNEAEVKTFAKAMGGSETITVEESVQMIRQLLKPATSKPQIVIVTRGSDPVLVDDGFNDLHKFYVPENVKVVDSVGCGDALAGAFLATYIHSRDINAAMLDGIRAAVEISQVFGCTPPKEQACVERQG